jgi:hypothetical protein
MVQQLTKRERATHRAEQPGEGGMRLSIAIDNENVVNPSERERCVRFRVADAVTRAFAEQERAHIETMAKNAETAETAETAEIAKGMPV